MKHFGDITKLNGAELPVVDCITGGSPCQDLSVAGKRAGLAGERSGLFMEQIRIVKEMRENDRRSNGRAGWHVRPRYMVWENVPGAFSSNNGEDFGAVLTEIAKIEEPQAAEILVPDGGWPYNGCIYDELGRWSIAWRVHDAQFWGVPQRRKRIALVADFGGLSAPEVLFERKGLRGNFEESGEPEQAASGASADSIGGAISFQERAGKPGGGKGILIQAEHVGALSTLNNQSVFVIDQGAGKSTCGVDQDRTPTLATTHGGAPAVAYGISSFDSNAMKSPNPHSGIYEADTARTLDLNGGNPACNQGGVAIVMCLNDQGGSVMGVSEDATGALRAQEHGHQPIVYDARGNGDGRTVPTLTGDHQNRITDYTALALETYHCTTEEDVVQTLKARDYKDPQSVLALENHPGQSSVVRRLTPTECERLQGYPDGWTDIGPWTDSYGKLHKESSDSARYKALGNSIAIPFWFYLLRRISAQYERPATLGSLFDGIGGFPYCWEKCNGKGTALWASEIEEFPIAVTKVHFPEVEP